MRARGLVLICIVAVGVSLGVTWAMHAVRGATSTVREDPLALLDLEPDQRLRIQELVRAYHPRLLRQQEEVEARRARLADVLVERGDDAAAVEACLRDVAEAEAELDREVVRNLLLLKPHLTREQQARLFRHIELRHPSVEKTPRPRGGR